MCKVSRFFGKLLVFLLVNFECVEGARLRNKFVYEKEISEHCMRRVMPSVFLGRHVVDAYAQVLYFSKADLPYSCYVSVRAESGSNVILVVQLLSADDLIAACAENANQLLVYEMGETFGGYWGPMPQTFQPESNSTMQSTRADIYTLKATRPTVPTVSSSDAMTTHRSSTTSEHIESSTESTFVEDQNYITIMVPLVNISGRYKPGEEDKESAFEQENFDLIYDVLPRQKEPYMTTMMPLVQFSVEQEPGGQRWGYEDLMSGYSFGQNWNTFTPDYRLKHQKYNGSINRRLKFKSNVSRRPVSHKHSTLFSAIHDGSITSKEMAHKKHPKYVIIDDMNTMSKATSVTTTETSIKEDSESWKYLEELISAYNKSGALTTLSDNKIKHEDSELLNKLNDLDINQSAYLSFPRSTNKLEFITKTALYPINKRPILTNRDKIDIDEHDNSQERNTTGTTMSLSESTNMTYSLEEFLKPVHKNISHSTMSTISTTESYKKMSYDFTSKDNEEQSYSKSTTEKLLNHDTIIDKQSIIEPTIHKLRTTPMTDTLLDHESWENLLRVAPAMAGRLDESMPQKILEELEKTSEASVSPTKSIKHNLLENTTDSKVTKTRHKRFIQGIMIEEAKPHKLTTAEEVATTTSSSIHISDIQHFAQLVELIDDDIHDRAALRYLSQYVGQPVFNLCSYEQPKPRYVQLFKSSRLVVAIGNFTLQSMQLVMTPANMLFTGKSRCEQSYLECQVAGNRVCIDSMSACDGVANCGTPDIYDEDRLMCGAYVGLKHNVCLAAITFIAVLLTLIYMVHYWLGRCVPKVSEAFFIYTEGDENVLYLDTIMRSPHDIDTGLPCGKSLDAFETDVMFTIDTRKESKMRAWFHKVFPYWFKKTGKKLSSIPEDPVHVSPTNTMFSFPELEIRRMIDQDHKNIAVQTGESLEMRNLPSMNETCREAGERPNRRQPTTFSSPISSDEQQRLKDELSLLKIINKIRYDSLTTRTKYNIGKQDSPFTVLSSNNEQYEEPEEFEIQSQFYDPRWQDRRQSGGQTRSAYTTKYDVQLEKPSKRLRFSEDVVNIPRTVEYSNEEISTHTSKYDVGSKLQDTTEESVPSTSRDFKRFWGGSKGKKQKKKTQTLTR